MAGSNGYQYLESRPGKVRLFVKGRKYPADILYGQAHGDGARTPEELARDFDLPLDAVQEALEYVEAHLDLVRQERAEENAQFEHRTAKFPSLRPPGHVNRP